jgi:hypothetical protein
MQVRMRVRNNEKGWLISSLGAAGRSHTGSQSRSTRFECTFIFHVGAVRILTFAFYRQQIRYELQSGQILTFSRP